VNALQLEAIRRRASRSGLFLAQCAKTAISQLLIKTLTSSLN